MQITGKKIWIDQQCPIHSLRNGINCICKEVHPEYDRGFNDASEIYLGLIQKIISK